MVVLLRNIAEYCGVPRSTAEYYVCGTVWVVGSQLGLLNAVETISHFQRANRMKGNLFDVETMISCRYVVVLRTVWSPEPYPLTSSYLDTPPAGV